MNSRRLIETSIGSWFLGEHPERKHLLRANRGRYAIPIHIHVLRLLRTLTKPQAAARKMREAA
jgi:hypothetical protein